MNKYTTEWTGRWPCYCSGEWKLYRNGELLDIEIPFQGEEAGTYGTYDEWYFTGDYEEVWTSHTDGMDGQEWIEEYKDWLASFAPKEDWCNIYFAFQEKDFRHMSCGGCV